MRTHLILFIAAFVTSSASAQLITDTLSPLSTINSNFLDNDYQISNVQYNGHYYSSGVYDATGTNIGLSHGILLTTGTVLDAPNGPHGPNNNGQAGIDNGTVGYQLLTNLLGGTTSTYNASVAEFDITTSIDSIGFKFIFGSDEYPEYVGSQYNDQVAIFISGPGINGQQNIALLPNGNTVSINNVNSGSNSSYYVHNGDGFQAPYNTDSTYIQYDGLTVPLVASRTGLQIDSTYHLIIAIADAGDGINDSGIFVERCSTCDFMLSVPEKDQTSTLSIYPNPSSGNFTIKTNCEQDGTLMIVDTSGKIILTTSEHSLEVSGLSKGMYFVQFTGDGSLEKIVVQ